MCVAVLGKVCRIQDAEMERAFEILEEPSQELPVPMCGLVHLFRELVDGE